VFKGTNPSNWQEVVKDLTFDPIKPTNGILWEQEVSKGVYVTLFSPYQKIGGKAPFEYIVEAIHESVLGQFQGPSVDLHVTGHSLGASYGTLCYAELLRLYNNSPARFSATGQPQFILRDLHTIGSPRIALEGFVDTFEGALAQHTGFSWRVVNKDDPIPMVPPPPILKPEYNFIHVDIAWEITSYSKPVKLPTERETTTQPPSLWALFKIKNHYTEPYKNSLLYAANNP